jgi:hypothetical protein
MAAAYLGNRSSEARSGQCTGSPRWNASIPGLEPLLLAMSAMHAPSCGSVELERRAGWSVRRAVTAMEAQRETARRGATTGRTPG